MLKVRLLWSINISPKLKEIFTVSVQFQLNYLDESWQDKNWFNWLKYQNITFVDLLIATHVTLTCCWEDICENSNKHISLYSLEYFGNDKSILKDTHYFFVCFDNVLQCFCFLKATKSKYRKHAKNPGWLLYNDAKVPESAWFGSSKWSSARF